MSTVAPPCGSMVDAATHSVLRLQLLLRLPVAPRSP
jgi:hypothetical protein